MPQANCSNGKTTMRWAGGLVIVLLGAMFTASLGFSSSARTRVDRVAEKLEARLERTEDKTAGNSEAVARIEAYLQGMKDSLARIENALKDK